MVTVMLMLAGLAARIPETQKTSNKKQIIPLAKKGTVLFTVSHPLHEILGY
jgi:hypothetical protein